jgi:hypothetical protein
MKIIGFEFYRGPSMIDGSPIVAIATLKSANSKTGDMVQTWIMRADKEPHTAVADGTDTAVCGDCPLKPSKSGICYVLTFQGPLRIFRSYKNGRYPQLHEPTEYRQHFLQNRMVRLGAYGDPAAVPIDIWTDLLGGTKGHTGYTHQWRTIPAITRYCQASCDTVADVIDATAAGHKVFFVVPTGSNRRTLQRKTGALLHDCPAVTGRKSTTCSACGLCNGKKAHIVIDAHGSGANKLLQEVI